VDPAIVIFGLGIGLLIGLTGVGGASLMTPLLILVFGIQPVTAVGTDIFYAAITKTVGGIRHLRLRTVHRALAMWLAVGAIPSAIAGVWLIELLQREYGESTLNEIVLGTLGGALLVVGVATLVRSLFLSHAIVERYAMHLYRRHIIAAVLTGALTGFVISVTSAGSGALVAIALIVIFRLTPQRVAGTSVFQAAVLLWVAGVAHWIGGNVDFALAGNILVGSIPGVIVGSQLSVKAPQALLRTMLALVLLAAGVILIAKEGTAEVVVPAIGIATVMVGGLLAGELITTARRPDPAR
jgi:uncharacterized protein